MGYSTPEGFLQSDVGQGWAARKQQLDAELDQRYPSARDTLETYSTGADHAATILYELARKQERSAGEDAILDLSRVMQRYEQMSQLGLLPSTIIDRSEAQAVRAAALEHVHDRRFVELYNLLFYRSFGPLEIAV